MKLMKIENVKVPENRQRREHDPAAHQDLITSLEGPAGLMHPIVLREGGFLVAGERRLRAVTEMAELGSLLRYAGEIIPLGMIPYTELGYLSPLDARQAELEENIRRLDLSWQERVQAESDLLALRKDQAKATPGAPIPTVRAVALEAGLDPKGLSKSAILANNLHRPEVAKAKSAHDAFKSLMRTEEEERNAEKAAALGKDFLGGKHRLFNWNCIEWMQQQPAGEFDVILSDPPYGMGADEFGDSGGGAEGAHFYEDNSDVVADLIKVLPYEFFRLAKADSHIYLFLDLDWWPQWRGEMKLAGWKVFRTPLIWYKPSAFRAPWPDKGPQRKYECILYALKGDLKCTKLGGDVLTHAPDVNLGHQAQKPVALFQDLLSRSARPGMKVLDPFCGTGPIFPAAHALSVIATGVEQDPAAFSIAATRIEALKGLK